MADDRRAAGGEAARFDLLERNGREVLDRRQLGSSSSSLRSMSGSMSFFSVAMAKNLMRAGREAKGVRGCAAVNSRNSERHRVAARLHRSQINSKFSIIR